MDENVECSASNCKAPAVAEYGVIAGEFMQELAYCRDHELEVLAEVARLFRKYVPLAT